MKEFLEIMRAVAAGGVRNDKTLVSGLMDRKVNDPVKRKLTEREQEILGLIAEGLSNAGIARRLSSRRAPSRER